MSLLVKLKLAEALLLCTADESFSESTGVLKLSVVVVVEDELVVFKKGAMVSVVFWLCTDAFVVFEMTVLFEKLNVWLALFPWLLLHLLVSPMIIKKAIRATNSANTHSSSTGFLKFADLIWI